MESTEYYCARCGYATKQKCHLVRHLNTKRVCPPLLIDCERSKQLEDLKQKYNEITYDCKYCKKKFNSKSNRSTHQAKCVQQPKVEVPMSDYIDLKAKVENIEKLLKTNTPHTIINNTVNTNNNIHIHVEVRDFAVNENKNYLDSGFLLDCFRDMDIIKVIEELHFNPEHPENHNVRIKNVKMNLMEYVESGKWVVGKKDEVLEYLVMNGYRVLHTYYKDNKADVEFELEDDEIRESLRWLKQIYNEDKTVFKELKDDAFLLVMNNKALLLKRS